MKALIGLALISALALGMSGCSKKTCETLADECDDWTNDVKEACIDDYKAGGACKDSIKELKSCVKDNGCDRSCADEVGDVCDDCNKVSAYCVSYK